VRKVGEKLTSSASLDKASPKELAISLWDALEMGKEESLMQCMCFVALRPQSRLMLDHVLAGDEKGLISDVKLKIEIRLASLTTFFSLALAHMYSIIL